MYSKPSLIRLQLFWIDKLKLLLTLSTYFKRHVGFRSKRTYRLVLRAAGDTETADWLQLDEGDPEFQLLTEEEIAAVILFIYFHQHYLYN
jgi:hypothetical protein